MFWDHPVFGAGLGAFRNQMIPTPEGLPLVIHSTAVWLLAELGIVGFLVFSAAFMYVFFKDWKCAPGDQTSALIVLCLAGSQLCQDQATCFTSVRSGCLSARGWRYPDRN